MKKSFGRSALALAVIGITAKLIGALYRVPLTNIVGAEGMGLYQMVFPLYTVLLAFCGGGVTNAVSRVVAKYTARGDSGTAKRVIKVAIVPLAAVSALSAGSVALLRNIISAVQGNADASLAYLALSPSLLFAGGISVLRGYFQGRSLMLPSGVSQLVEQVIKLALGLSLARLLLKFGVKFAVAGALIGVSASELLALIYLFVRFLIYRRGRILAPSVAAAMAESATDAVFVTDRELRREIYLFALPVTLGSLVLPVTQMIDSALVINILIRSGAGREGATALFGLFVGPVGTLINMPSVVVLSVAIAFLPTLTAAVERGDKQKIIAVKRDAAKWIMLFVIPVTTAFLLFPTPIVSALYRRGLTAEQLSVAASILRIQAVGVLFSGVIQLTTTIMQAHNFSHKPVINLVIGACIKVALTPLLVGKVGIIGAAGATTACYGVAAALNSRAVYKVGGVGAAIKHALLLPTVFSALSAGAFIGIYAALSFTALPVLWKAAIAAAVFLAVYASILFFGVIDISAVKKALSAKKLREAKRRQEKE